MEALKEQEGPQPIYSGNQNLKACHKWFRNLTEDLELTLNLKWCVPLNAQ